MAKSEEFIQRIQELCDEYILHCKNSTKEVATGSGKVVQLKERHIPTIDYFLNIWIPLIKKEETMCNKTYYLWLKSDEENKLHAIKSIDDKFKALAADIVANEQKGIFYAKNKLGWTDRADIINTNMNVDVSMDLGEKKTNEDKL